MHHSSKLGAALLMAALSPCLVQGANRGQTYDEMAAASDKVVLGTVSARSSHWGDDSRIYTDILVYPDVTLKGDDEGAVLVQALGGTVGDTTMTVSDGPEFPQGERLILFLKRDGGHFVVTGRAAGSIAISSAQAAGALEGAFHQMERSRAPGVTYRRGIAESYMARAAATAGHASAAVQNGCYSTDGAKWSTASATYRIGTSIPSGWEGGIDASAATWSNAGAAFGLVKDSGSVNELSYLDLVAKYGSSYSNTLAVTTTWSSVSTGRISKATIEFNSKWSWSPDGASGAFDVQNIATHEFGHWMRLLDIYSPSTCGDVTMWGSAGNGETKKRTLEQADIDGFVSLYGGSGSSTTVTAPVLVSPSNGVTGVSASTTLVWNAASNATSYDVYFGTSVSPPLAANVTGTSLQPANLVAGATYYWRVAAKNASSSATSATYSFTVAPAGVTAPVLSSPANGATGVSTTPALVWNAAANATSYDLYLGTAVSPPLLGTLSGTSYQPGSLTAGSKYYWRVVAKNAAGSATSATYSFTVAAAGGTVSAPALVAPANGATGVSTAAALVWNAAANATSYEVYFGTASSPPLAATVIGTTYLPGTLTGGLKYYWRVVAKNAGSSASSATYSFTAAAPGGTSGPNLMSPADGATGLPLLIFMRWSAVSGASSYDIYIGTSPSPNFIGTVYSTGVNVRGFQPGTTYYWKVVARTPAGSLSSAVASFTTN